MSQITDDWKTRKICKFCWLIATHICHNASLKGDYYCSIHLSDCCERLKK